MKIILSFILLIGLPLTQVHSKSLVGDYTSILNTPECQEAPKTPVLIEYGETMLIKDGGSIKISFEPSKVILEWATTYQSFDFSNGEMFYKGIDFKTKNNLESAKDCFDTKTGKNCGSLAKLYWNIFLQRPIEYLEANPNIDHMNAAVCAQRLVKTFSEFFDVKK